MELSYDWKAFQTVFFTRKSSLPNIHSPISLVTDKRVVVSIFSDGEDFSDWIGATYDEVLAEFPQRDLVVYDRDKVDLWMKGSLSQPHFYDQIQHLRQEAKAYVLKSSDALLGPANRMSVRQQKIQDLVCPEHFLVKAMSSWWVKILPSNYGVYLNLSSTGKSGDLQNVSLLLMIQRGKLVSFQVPDFHHVPSSFRDRIKNPADRVKFLMEQYLMPIQGIFLTMAEWQEWSTAQNPWNEIASVLKKNKKKLIPSNFALKTLITTRAGLGL